MKILIAEDDPVSRRLLESKLQKWEYDVVVTRDGVEAFEALQSPDAPLLAILDWMMPGMDGVEVCRRVRQEVREPYTYIILLSSLHRDENIITGMDAGADDYIAKPFKSSELKVRLRAGRRIVELQKALIQARQALWEKATHDSLTGLWNHEEVLAILERELSRAKREKENIGVLMLDIDHFKRINDTHGHVTGDAVLSQLAGIMTSTLRSYDSIGRYGGEEFLVILPGCTGQNTLDIAERLRMRVINSRITDGGNTPIPVTISLGAASYNSSNNCDAGNLVNAADQALYRAKENGRNRVESAG